MAQALAANPLTESPPTTDKRIKKSSTSVEPIVLTDIYNDECNIAIWQRHLDDTFLTSLATFVKGGGKLTAARQ